MSNMQLRSEIGKLLGLADERLLSTVYSMMKSYIEHDESIVGFTVEGEPLTKQDLLTLAEDSMKDGLKGKVIGADDLVAEIEHW